PLVNWVQGTPLRKLAFALRPLIDQGLDVQRIVLRLDDWAYGWKPGWRPTNTPALIAARIRRDAEEAARSAAAAEEARREEEARAAAPHPMDNPEWRAWVETSRPAAP
ncbi:cell wall protein, partial [Streptomyces sp. SID11233]|nr:cell wall protein [Streptomyces sp. SID11233]